MVDWFINKCFFAVTLIQGKWLEVKELFERCFEIFSSNGEFSWQLAEQFVNVFFDIEYICEFFVTMVPLAIVFGWMLGMVASIFILFNKRWREKILYC